ncbi:MAG: hypothetical protein LBR82_01970 [Desulfovibrio sp.]|jgi:hypothetical protein|nr:hypothetical protein [Desulfovibrio sp.]
MNFIIQTVRGGLVTTRTIKATSRTAALRAVLSEDGHGDVAVPRGARFLAAGEDRYEVAGVQDFGGTFYPHEDAMRIAHRRDRERR